MMGQVEATDSSVENQPETAANRGLICGIAIAAEHHGAAAFAGRRSRCFDGAAASRAERTRRKPTLAGDFAIAAATNPQGRRATPLRPQSAMIPVRRRQATRRPRKHHRRRPCRQRLPAITPLPSTPLPSTYLPSITLPPPVQLSIRQPVTDASAPKIPQSSLHVEVMPVSDWTPPADAAASTSAETKAATSADW